MVGYIRDYSGKGLLNHMASTDSAACLIDTIIGLETDRFTSRAALLGRVALVEGIERNN